MKNITLISRILISALFLLSAVAKLYPTPLYGITKVFEEGQLIPMGFSSDFAPFLSRLIIGFEFFIAFAILQSHYIKKLVIPSTILLLSVFCIDLAIDIFGGVDENCGCFGQLIPMTPMEAFIKNIFTILLLIFIASTRTPPGNTISSGKSAINFISLNFFLLKTNKNHIDTRNK